MCQVRSGLVLVERNSEGSESCSLLDSSLAGDWAGGCTYLARATGFKQLFA